MAGFFLQQARPISRGVILLLFLAYRGMDHASGYGISASETPCAAHKDRLYFAANMEIKEAVFINPYGVNSFGHTLVEVAGRLIPGLG